MAYSRGRNNGITGTVDILGVRKFEMWALAFSRRVGVGVKQLREQGKDYLRADALQHNGTLLLRGKVRKDGFPEPESLRGAEGSVKLTFIEGHHCTVTVMFTSCTISQNEKSTDDWDVSLEGQIIGMSTWAWTGSQTEEPEIVFERIVRGDPAFKQLDPNQLQEASTIIVDVIGLEEGDVTDCLEIISHFTRDPSVPALADPNPIRIAHKVRSVSMQREGKYSATITIQYGLTTTLEDVENPGTSITTDPEDLASQAAVTRVNADPTPPTADFIDRGTTVQELHDGATRKTTQYGLLSTDDDITYPGTPTRKDPDAIESTAQVTQTAAHPETGPVEPPDDPDAPADAPVLMWREGVRINRKRWRWSWGYSNTGTQGRIAYPREVIEREGQLFTPADTTSIFTSKSDAPANEDIPVSRIEGLVLRRQLAVRVAEDPEQWHHIFQWASRDELQDAEFPGRVLDRDIDAVETKAMWTVHAAPGDNGEMPAEPTPLTPPFSNAPILVRVERQQVNVFWWRFVFHYSNTGNLAAQGYGNSVFDRDMSPGSKTDHPLGGSGIGDSDTTYVFTASSALPPLDGQPNYPASRHANMTLRTVESVRIAEDPEQWMHLFRWGRRTLDQDITFKSKRDALAANYFGATRTIIEISDSKTPSDLPDATTDDLYAGGLTLISVESVQETAPAGTAPNDYKGRWIHTHIFGNSTQLQKLTNSNFSLQHDPTGIEGEEVTVEYTDTSTRPTSFTAPPGQPTTVGAGPIFFVRSVNTAKISDAPEKWMHRITWAKRTQLTDRTWAASPTTITPYSDLIVAANVVDVATNVPLASYITSNRTTLDTYDEVSLRRIAADKIETVTKTSLTDKLIEFSARGTKTVRRKTDGNTVQVLQVVQVDSTRYSFMTAELVRDEPVGVLSITRRIVDTPANIRLACKTDLIGTINNDAFLDFEANTLKFTGAEVAYLNNGTTERVATIKYNFEYNGYSHFDETLVGDPGVWYEIEPSGPTTVPSVGQVSLGDLGWSVGQFFDRADFDQFLADPLVP